ncbi:MAG: nitrophenyl compound nitroreductase subunit ArsF family protein [Bacteroides sp.]|nr:nitrophenyl compound nitroreductase subunit ArsF family protein [Bacteroides sp.]
MSILKSSILIVFAALSLVACNTQSKESSTSEKVLSEDVQIYYFHNTKRCATCNAVEDETKVALEMYYKDGLEAGTVGFVSLNLEEDEGAEMAQVLHVSGQTLLLVKGETQVNLTNEGFMNARTNPEKFHEILKAQIDNLL